MFDRLEDIVKHYEEIMFELSNPSVTEDVKKFHDAGHSVQNHSDAHPHVNGMNINSLIEDTRECSRKIKMITGEEPVLYRSPYGEYDDNVITTVEGMGLKVIQWSVEALDIDGKPL